MTKTTKPRIIVNNKTSLSDADALQRVVWFMAGKDDYLNHITEYNDGCKVSARRNLRSVTVHVWQEGEASE